MTYAPLDGETRQRIALARGRQAAVFPMALKLPPHIAPARVDPNVAERVADRMIARHGANAAREAIVRLNKMIDRGDLPTRDLWASVVHVIHERGAEALAAA